MATSRKSDLQRQLRELDEARARLIAEIKDEEEDLVNEGINLPDGTRDGDDDGKERERSKSQCTAEDAVATGAEKDPPRRRKSPVDFTQFTMAYMSLATAGSAKA